MGPVCRCSRVPGPGTPPASGRRAHALPMTSFSVSVLTPSSDQGVYAPRLRRVPRTGRSHMPIPGPHKPASASSNPSPACSHRDAAGARPLRLWGLSKPPSLAICTQPICQLGASSPGEFQKYQFKAIFHSLWKCKNIFNILWRVLEWFAFSHSPLHQSCGFC